MKKCLYYIILVAVFIALFFVVVAIQMLFIDVFHIELGNLMKYFLFAMMLSAFVVLKAYIKKKFNTHGKKKNGSA